MPSTAATAAVVLVLPREPVTAISRVPRSQVRRHSQAVGQASGQATAARKVQGRKRASSHVRSSRLRQGGGALGRPFMTVAPGARDRGRRDARSRSAPGSAGGCGRKGRLGRAAGG